MENIESPVPVRGNLRLALGPLLAIAGGLAAYFSELGTPISWTVAITLCCATWWMTEALPHAVTALLPLAAFPLLGILTPNQVAQSYGNPLILLLAGGFILAAGLQANGAHRRLALAMVHGFGGRSGRHLVYGFAAAAGLCSMWISNTATTLMLLPVALAVLADYPDRRVAVPLILAIAYCASIGGLGTPIGSPPNLVFMQVYEQSTGESLGFSGWARFGLPTVLILLPLTAWWLGRGLAGSPPARIPELGPWRPAERRVLSVFALVAVAWVTRSEPFGGWSSWLDLPGASDASVALFGVILMSVVPDGRGRRLLRWEDAERIPWGALILFGGGIALATAFETSGLSTWLALKLQGALDAPLLVRIALIAIAVSLLSEIASNTAAAVLLMPLLAAAAKASGIDPALLMVPAVLAASCAFLLPVATAPNAIAFGSGLITAQDMLRKGLAVNIVAIGVITLVCAVVLR